jgi:uncharacterized protein (DUF427 family)
MPVRDSDRRATPGTGQESVWDYPRPPKLDRVAERLRVVHGGRTIADTTGGFRVLETSHPPVYYFPLADVQLEFMKPAGGRPVCEFKGAARYWSVEVDGRRSEQAAWSYPDPEPNYAVLKDFIAFYASRVDECWVGDERAKAQEGDYYGGWITSKVVGPFKGAAGTMSW